MADDASRDGERVREAVKHDPAVRAVVEHLWRVHSCDIDEPTGAYVRGEDDALELVARDALHAVEWARDPSLPGCRTQYIAAELAFYDSGLHDPYDMDDALLDGDIRAVVDAVSAYG